MPHMTGFIVGNDGASRPALGHCPGFYQRKTKTFFKACMVGGIDPRAKAKAYLVREIVCFIFGESQQNGGQHSEVVQRRSP